MKRFRDYHELMEIRDLCRALCSSLNDDASMSKEAFGRLCTLAHQVGMTHMPWFDNDHVAGEQKK